MKIKEIKYEEMKKYFYLDSSIPEGLRWRIKKTSSIKIGDPAGRLSNGYFDVGLEWVKYRNHRIIYSIANNVDLTDEIIDHIDRTSQNNNPSNLRIVTTTQNNRNRTKSKNKSSKYRGVWFDKERNKWIARIVIDRKSKFLGRFDSEFDAANAYNNFIITHNLEFFNLNEI